MSKSMLNLKFSFDLRFVLSVVLVALAGLFQTANIDILGIKPDIILPAVLLAALANKDWWKRIILVLTAALVIQYYPGLDSGTILFIIAALAGIIAIDFIPTEHFINFLVAVVLGTLIINLANFILAAFFLELIYNLLFALVIFTVINKYTQLD